MTIADSLEHLDDFAGEQKFGQLGPEAGELLKSEPG